jgi:hypothetical protein
MRNYVFLFGLALLTTNCSNDLKESDIKFGDEPGVKVTFSAVINDQNATGLDGTRATEISWEDGDVVGITCGEKQVNVSYAYTSAPGNYFHSVNKTKEIWLMGSEEYAVSAYYPYTGQDGVAPATLTVETKSENNATAGERQKIDFLYASGAANREEPNVQLSFYHVMSRMVLTFKGEGVELKDIDCYITGFRLSGTFNPNTGVTTVDESTASESVNQILTGANNHTMTAIFLPQLLADKTLLIEAGMNGIYYKVELPASEFPELKPGYSYNYTITAQNYSDEPIRLTITGTEIIPWVNSDGGSFMPDPSPAGTETGITPSDWGNVDNVDITPTAK